MKTSVNLYRRSQEKQFSKDKDVQGEKELEIDTSVSLEGKQIVCSKVKGVVHMKTSFNTCYTQLVHTLTVLLKLSLVFSNS